MSQAVVGSLAKLQSVPGEIARWQKAQQKLMACQYDSALDSYRQLISSYSDVPQLWFELGMSATGALEFLQADEAFQTACRLASNDVQLLLLIGQQYQKLRMLDRARECYELAVAADESYSHARLSLAAWFERERKLARAWDCVETCLEIQPRDASALYYRAFLQHRRGMNAEAETALRDLIKSGTGDPGIKQSSRHLLAVVLDELGNYAEAMRWLRESKFLLRQISNTRALETMYDQTDLQRRQLLKSLKAADILRWQSESAPETASHKISLLAGHPRSGTTLIEQILAAHPEVVAFDEPESFSLEVINPVSQFSGGLTLDRLNRMDAITLGRLRDRYLKSLLREVHDESAGCVFIDKNPSSTASLHLWLRLFPGSKIIMPLRDPRDVVVSCFFQNFALTSPNVNFLSLDRAVRHYSDLMDVWLRLKELGGFAWLETRYEDVVQNLESEGRRMTEFLGLPWHDQQANYYESAKKKFVFSPTYHEVTKPVHNRAVARWAHYAEHFAPVLSRLAPYCKAFGYQ